MGANKSKECDSCPPCAGAKTNTKASHAGMTTSTTKTNVTFENMTSAHILRLGPPVIRPKISTKYDEAFTGSGFTYL